MPQIVTEALVAMIVALTGTGMITLIMRARHLYGWPERKGRPFGPSEEDVKLAALKSNEKLASEKLDLLRRAIDMGWKDAELKELDGRLEALIGKDSVARIVGSTALPAAELNSSVDDRQPRVARERLTD